MKKPQGSPWLKLAAWAGLAVAAYCTADEAGDLLRALGSPNHVSGELTHVLLMLGATLLCLIGILWTSGRGEGREEVALTWQERVPFELYAAAMAVPAVFEIALGINGVEYLYYSEPQSEEYFVRLGICALWALLVLLAALVLRTLAVRLKAGIFLKSTLTYYVVTGVWKVVKGLFGLLVTFFLTIPLTWRVLAGFGGYSLFTLYTWTRRYPDPDCRPLWFLVSLAVLALLCWWTVSFHKLRQGTEAIVAGNLEHQIDTHRMPPDLRRHGETLNHLSDGLHNAVAEQMKSERMKAELITNVSHDLKTPLTSIINYVDLLKQEDIPEGKAREYIEVLDRKSQRLKRLTEDLVEASKASTGALTVSKERLNMNELVEQAVGEYSERFAAGGLVPVVTLPKKEVYITADGRHLWRVLDNLLGNCAKYAMEGTRVYLDLVEEAGNVALTVKNISAQPLNIPAEQLVERFVRGDESRTTEGSGLGLSIARSLTELQGGTFRLEVDGDLFKAVVTFPETY